MKLSFDVGLVVPTSDPKEVWMTGNKIFEKLLISRPRSPNRS